MGRAGSSVVGSHRNNSGDGGVMFKFLRRDLLLVLAVAAVLLALSYAIEPETEDSGMPVESEIAFLDGSRAPRKQAAAGRVWKEYAFKKTAGLDESAVKRPVVLRVGHTGEFYLLDWADYRVKMFSPEGQLLQTFGEGKGTGEGGFVNPTAYSVRPDGELWVCDPPQQIIRRYSPGGNMQVLIPQSAVHRVEAVGDVMVTMVPPGTDTLFDVYDLSGKRLRSFGELIKNQRTKSIALDGNVAGDDESSGFVYAGWTMPVIAGYGVDGEQRFIVQPIESGAPPPALNIGARQKANPNATTVTWSLSIAGDKLYVLSGAKAPGESKSGFVMDVYDKRNGSYLFSFKLPLACREAVVRADHIYAVARGGGVWVWRFSQST